MRRRGYQDLEPLTPLGRTLAEILNESDRELELELAVARAARRRAAGRIRRAITASTIATAAVLLAVIVGIGLFFHWADRGCPAGQTLKPSGITVDVTPTRSEPVLTCQR